MADMPRLVTLTSMTSKIRTPEPSAAVENSVEVTVPLYSDDDFRAHFRMQRSTFQVSSKMQTVASYPTYCTSVLSALCFQVHRYPVLKPLSNSLHLSRRLLNYLLF